MFSDMTIFAPRSGKPDSLPLNISEGGESLVLLHVVPQLPPAGSHQTGEFFCP